MIHYYPNPIPITAEEEKVIKHIAKQDAKEQKDNPAKVYWWERDCEAAE